MLRALYGRVCLRYLASAFGRLDFATLVCTRLRVSIRK